MKTQQNSTEQEFDFVHRTDFVGASVVDGAVDCYVVLDLYEGAFREAAVHSLVGDASQDGAAFRVHFPLRAAFDVEKTLFAVLGKKGVITAEGRPVLLAIRAEFQKMIDEIDALRFESEESAAPVSENAQAHE